MRKIISLFQRDYDGDRLVKDEVVPGAEWVLAGEGVPTRKYDGTCCAVIGGALFKRYDAKIGKTPPDGFIPADDIDTITGHWPGWVAVREVPEDRWHLEAWATYGTSLLDGTYELIGPKIQGNRERWPSHVFMKHGDARLADLHPRTFVSIKEQLSLGDIEGIVWHHQDGRMVKIKGKDFGIWRR